VRSASQRGSIKPKQAGYLQLATHACVLSVCFVAKENKSRKFSLVTYQN
jgi:hypothetical protein